MLKLNRNALPQAFQRPDTKIAALRFGTRDIITLTDGALLDRDQLDFEDQRRVRGDGAARGAALAVGQLRVNGELILRAFLHELHALGPARDDAVQRELGGLTALDGAIEFGAIEQRALVMDLDDVGGLRALARAFLEYLVLKSAGGGFHTFLFCVFREERFAFFGIGISHEGRNAARSEDGCTGDFCEGWEFHRFEDTGISIRRRGSFALHGFA